MSEIKLDTLVHIREASTYINRSVKYIQNNIRNHPMWFPPCIKATARSPIEFRMSDIQAWIANLPIQHRAIRK